MEERKIRSKKIVLNAVKLMLIGVLYYVWIMLTDIKIPCVFYMLTNKFCPGCGITRMFLALFKLDFVTAMKNNLLVFCLIWPGLLWGVIKSFFYIKDGTVQTNLFEKICVMIIFVCTIVFWILRNTSYASFLQPIA